MPIRPIFAKKRRSAAAILLFALLLSACSRDAGRVAPRRDYAPLVAKLQACIEYQMQDKSVPGLSIALVDDQDVVWARGFGVADRDKNIPATAQTVYRIASVSKLFTDLAVMQLVERGELDLDVPIQNYLPDFRPENPFGKPQTLRQLLSHHSGLVREPPVGSYFDPSEPPLQQVVASLNRTQIVYEPETRTKYSNAAITLLGWLLQQRSGQPYSDYIAAHVLQPAGLRHSSFVPTEEILQKLSQGYLWTYDGRMFAAPHFEYGIGPAANLYAPMTDLAQFLKVLFHDGRGPGGQVVQPETLQRMWRPQFTGGNSGFGLGFYVTEYRGFKRIGHTGAVHGYSTEFIALPELKFGLAMCANKDGAYSMLRRISLYAFDLAIARRGGAPLPDFRRTDPVAPEVARRLAGKFSDGERNLELVERDGELYAWYGGVRARVRARGDTLITDDVLAYGTEIVPQAPDHVLVNGRGFHRLPDVCPPPPPPRWHDLIGEYGWDHNTQYILEKDGRLYSLIEWFFLYPLTELRPDVFAFPDYGLYQGEELHFRRDAAGRVTRVVTAGVPFARREVGTEAGQVFRIRPQKPVPELRRIALAASPPPQPDTLLQPNLVDLAKLEPTLKFDIRYATTNNFVGAKFYEQPRAFLQRPAAEALVRVQRRLRQQGFGLLIHDAYRPWYVTKMFWDATPDSLKRFVADPAKGSIHNRGAAVDLTLFDLATGKPVDMVSGYDEFSPRAYPAYPGGTSRQRWHRELLRRSMEAEGFRVYRWEWWHFNAKNARRYPVLNVRFEELETPDE